MTTIRDARDADARELIRLIGGVYQEYPGCVLDVEGEEPALRSIATAFAALGGHFWVATDDSGVREPSRSDVHAHGPEVVVACCGCAPRADEGALELKKLYVRRDRRRRGLAKTLVTRVVDIARQRGVSRILCWSDTRFVEAHAFYQHFGFRQTANTRELEDLSESTEFEFILEL